MALASFEESGFNKINQEHGQILGMDDKIVAAIDTRQPQLITGKTTTPHKTISMITKLIGCESCILG